MASVFIKLNKPIVLKLACFCWLIGDISRKPTYVLLTSMSASPLNRITHSYCRFQGQSHPVDKAFAPSVVHMGILRLSFLPVRDDAGRQSWWPWPVSQACTLWHCVARAAATGPGSLCQLVPDLSDSQTHSHVCCGGRQRWHEVLIRPLAPHPSEGVSDSSISCHSQVPAAHSESQMSCLSSWHLCLRTDIDRPYDWHINSVWMCVSGFVVAYVVICHTVFYGRASLVKDKKDQTIIYL